MFSLSSSTRLGTLIFLCQVGAKSRNISYLRGKVPDWVGIPTSVALPFGVFEKVLEDKSNKVRLGLLRFLRSGRIASLFAS